MNKELEMTPNVLVEFLQKPASEFTKEDIIRYIYEKDIQMVNFMYPAGDGRLKTLNFVINNAAYLDAILTCGERVDGSSLFSFIEAGSSDLYVVPRFRTAFEDPFAELPTLTMLCSFFNKDGEPLESSPEYTLHKACKAFHEVTGMDFEAMGELEYYVIAPDEGVFPATDQKGYHESAPYAKFNEFRTECMHCIAQAGGQIKYGHSEVGNFTLNGLIYEQNEIEFLPCPAENAADQLMIAKWAIRNLAHEYGYNITFAPKITVGKAGSGLHVHMRIMKDGKNQMLANGILSETARKAIAGMMCLASSITAFGNTNPTSYFRLVPHQDHAKISQMFEEYIARVTPPYVKVKVTPSHGGQGYVCPIDLPAYQAAEKAVGIAFGKKPLAVRRGGSIPIISTFEQVLGIKTVLMGFGLEQNAIHSPNESQELDIFFKGIESVAEFYRLYK